MLSVPKGNIIQWFYGFRLHQTVSPTSTAEKKQTANIQRQSETGEGEGYTQLASMNLLVRRTSGRLGFSNHVYRKHEEAFQQSLSTKRWQQS
jgi:hypothetical protein